MVINRMCFWQITPVLCVRYNQSHRTPNQQPEGTNVLTIHYGDMENVIYNTSVYFDNVYSPQWFQDAFAQRIIKSIDKGFDLPFFTTAADPQRGERSAS